ncbi:MAG: SDR family oxidoreductase, partial [Pirellulaceae bacterium]
MTLLGLDPVAADPATKETVLITGASSGIGAALAKRFAADGSTVLLTARRADRLRQLSDELRSRFGVQTDELAYDLAAHAGPRELVEQIRASGRTVDVLVNNAGFGLLGAFWTRPVSEQMQVIQLNVAALTELTGHFLPGMIERGRGGVLNVSSTTAFQPGPGMAVYFASKAYVQRFSEALAYELRETPITVTALAPGPVQTEFGNRSGMSEHRPRRRNMMTADRVAEIG